MSCNANNHHPNCTCGWGGVNYGTNSPTARSPIKSRLMQLQPINISNRPYASGLQVATNSRLAGGFVNPNAICKYCGESVYYYESSNGGQVFFDSLGPPWPKHSCFEENQSSFKKLLPIKESFGGWVKERWQPLTGVEIYKKPGLENIYEINGIFDGFAKKMFFETKIPVIAHIFRYMVTPRGLYEISILDFHKVTNTWFYWSGVASIDYRNIPSPLKITVVSGNADVRSHLEGKYEINKNRALFSSLLKEPNPDDEEFVCCPLCQGNLKRKSLKKHFKKVHSL
jgi:hypothetical protein